MPEPPILPTSTRSENDPRRSVAANLPEIHQRNGILFGAQGLRAGWGITIFFLLFAVGVAFQIFLLRRTGNMPTATPHAISPRMALLNEVVPLSVVLLITALLAKIEGRPFTGYGLGGERKIPRFFAGLAWGVAFLSLLVLLLAVSGLLRFDGRLLAAPAALGYGLAWAGCFLLVALFEETFLRGYLQLTLARGLSAIYGALSATRHRDALGFWTAALLLSVLFGAGHHSNSGESPLGLLAAAFAGLVFCLSLWRTGSLWWAIGFHTAWDWAQSFLYGVADSGSISAGRLFATHPVGRPILSGGLTGPEGSAFVLPVLALAATVIALTLPRSAPATSHHSVATRN